MRARARLNRGRRGQVAVAHAHLGAHRRARLVERDPVDARGRELFAQQIFLAADDDAVALRVNRDDVKRALVR